MFFNQKRKGHAQTPRGASRKLKVKRRWFSFLYCNDHECPIQCINLLNNSGVHGWINLQSKPGLLGLLKYVPGQVKFDPISNPKRAGDPGMDCLRSGQRRVHLTVAPMRRLYHPLNYELSSELCGMTRESFVFIEDDNSGAWVNGPTGLLSKTFRRYQKKIVPPPPPLDCTYELISYFLPIES